MSNLQDFLLDTESQEILYSSDISSILYGNTDIYEILTEGIQGPPGPPGSSGPAGASYNHTQSTPSSQWVVNHNLGFYPSVSISTVGRVSLIGSVVHLSENTSTISFNSSVSGFARFN